MKQSTITMRDEVTIHAGESLEQWTLRAFSVALLLTGSVEAAESAVLESIRMIDIRPGSGEQLLAFAVAVAVERRPPDTQPSQDVTGRSSVLPWELNSVIYLSPGLRHCFVLRFLLGWSREATARLLRLSASVVDERTWAAAIRLTYIRQVFEAPPHPDIGLAMSISDLGTTVA